MAKQEKTVEATPSKVADFKNVMGVMADLNKHYGKNLVKSGKDIPFIHKVPFGEPALDFVTDGGIPIGRMTEFIGEAHAGKTRNALKIMGNFQRYCFGCFTPDTLTAVWRFDKGGNPELVSCKCSNCNNPTTKIQVIVDTEGTIDPLFMQIFGIMREGVIYTRPDRPSQAVGIVDTFLRVPEIGLILFDSIGSMGSDKEVDTAIEDDKMNQNALFMNKATRKWQMSLNSNTNVTGTENGTTLIVVNQTYVTLSIYSTEVAQGGRGLRHGKGLSVKTKIIEKTKDASGEILGVHVRYSNEKNKTGVPYRKSEYYLNLDKNSPVYGYCQTNTDLQYIEYAIKYGIIVQTGSWYEYNGAKFQGKTNLINSVDDKLREDVNKIIYNNVKSQEDEN